MATDSTAEVKSATAARPKADGPARPGPEVPSGRQARPSAESGVEQLEGAIALCEERHQSAIQEEALARVTLREASLLRESIGKELSGFRSMLREAKRIGELQRGRKVPK